MLVRCLWVISIALAVEAGTRLNINFDFEKIESYRPITPRQWCENETIAKEYGFEGDKRAQQCCVEFLTCTSDMSQYRPDHHSPGHICVCEVSFNSCVSRIDGGKFIKEQNADRIAMGYYLSYMRPTCF